MPSLPYVEDRVGGGIEWHQGTMAFSENLRSRQLNMQLGRLRKDRGMRARKRRISLLHRLRWMAKTNHIFNFELTNALSAVARAKENLVNALFQLNASRIHFARSTGSLESLN